MVRRPPACGATAVPLPTRPATANAPRPGADGRVAGTDAGLHILLHLPDGTNTRAVIQATAAAGLRLADLDDYRTKRSVERALVLGYGNISDTEIHTAVGLLRDALRSAPPTVTAQPQTDDEAQHLL